MNIHSKSKWPANFLSNFASHSFIIDGVECSSMEGFLQSLKEKDPAIQIEIYKLTGIEAKRRGEAYNETWKREQKLWWQGKKFVRYGDEYQKLLDRAFEKLAKNEDFQKALLATEGKWLTHSIGKKDKKDTVLTIEEFCCSRLVKIRKKLLTEH